MKYYISTSDNERPGKEAGMGSNKRVNAVLRKGNKIIALLRFDNDVLVLDFLQAMQKPRYSFPGHFTFDLATLGITKESKCQQC